ncbi:MAG: zinc-binding dehydrogenase [Saprospiraceae bacterium]|nr:zinc-binding dehydrogenase [Saprospiraceae bacterium]MCB9320938.1 zinc-binding dehydrogenase [Lewinellaceae bacterium]
MFFLLVNQTVIDRTYALEEIQEAHRYAEQFRNRGDVVIRVIRK